MMIVDPYRFAQAGGGSYQFDGVDDRINGTLSISVGRTIVAWVKRDSSIAKMAAVMTGDVNGSDSDQNRNTMFTAQGTGSNRVARAEAFSSTGISSGVNAGNFVDGDWVHIAGRFFSATYVDVFLNGVAGPNLSSRPIPNKSDIVIGADFSTAYVNFMSGYIAQVAVWDRDLTPAQIADLAAGALPSTVQPGNLVFYAPLDNGEARDVISGNLLTVTGAVPSTDGPPL